MAGVSDHHSLTVVVVVPPDRQELEVFLDALAQFAERAAAPVGLVLIDVFQQSDQYLSDIAVPGVAVRVELAYTENQFQAMLAVACTCQSDVVVTMDPDMAGNLDDLPAMLERINQGAELVYGVRLRRDDVSPLRRLLSRLFNRLMQKFMYSVTSDMNTPLVMLTSSFASRLAGYSGESGLAKLYYPWLLGDAFHEHPVAVRCPRKRSSYRLFQLLQLALSLTVESWVFRNHVSRLRRGRLDCCRD